MERRRNRVDFCMRRIRIMKDETYADVIWLAQPTHGRQRLPRVLKHQIYQMREEPKKVFIKIIGKKVRG